MIQFYAPDIEQTLTLPESDSGHCARVLRLREGDEIFVVDGRGTRFRCAITCAHHKHTTVEILDRESLPSHWSGKITVAVSPPKSIDRLEWFAEKATEMGIDRIVLLRCARSERKDVRVDRIEKILVSAMKQSLKGVLPELVGMTPISEFLRQSSGARFMGYCDKDTPRRLFVDELRPADDVTVMIGPEGDFTPDEVSEAVNSGFLPVTFGASRLRTETAALFAVAAFHVVNQISNSK